MKTKVALLRGRLKSSFWNDSTEDRARQRANALAELHSAEVKETDEGFEVDASEYYGKEE